MKLLPAQVQWALTKDAAGENTGRRLTSLSAGFGRITSLLFKKEGCHSVDHSSPALTGFTAPDLQLLFSPFSQPRAERSLRAGVPQVCGSPAIAGG